MNKIAFFGAMNCGLSVALGAFGAHGLKAKITPEMLEIFKTGSDYQFYHGLALLCLAWAPFNKHYQRAANFFIIGIILFSGSLYVLACSGVKKWGMVTPFGGLCFLIAWSLVIYGSMRSNCNNQALDQQSI